MGDGVMGCTMTDLVPVGTKPAGDGRWGQSELGGNVWEWVLDWYAAPYPMMACTDCANLNPGSTERGMRGGGYLDVADGLRVSVRYNLMPLDRFRTVGIRCARAP